jgi:hypothetical protein
VFGLYEGTSSITRFLLNPLGVANANAFDISAKLFSETTGGCETTGGETTGETFNGGDGDSRLNSTEKVWRCAGVDSS